MRIGIDARLVYYSRAGIGQYIMRLAERGEKIALAVQAGRNDPASIREREAYQREAAVMVKEQQRRMKVAMAGINMGRWSWSTGALDFDSDGWEDLYAVNGFISGPIQDDV